MAAFLAGRLAETEKPAQQVGLSIELSELLADDVGRWKDIKS
jgi:hypothetical protein